MANLTDTASAWEAGVYQIELTDPVIGGAPNPATNAGMSNIPHLQLARRTVWLKGQVEALQNGGGYKSALTFTGNQTLAAADAGKCYIYGETTAVTLTLPTIAATPVGSIFEFINTGTASMTVQRAGSDQIDSGPSAVNSIVVPPNQSLKLIRATGSSLWHPVGVTAAGLATSFNALLATGGYQRLPSGLIIQWAELSAVSATEVTWTYPIAFPTACVNVQVTDRSSASGATTVKAFGHDVPGLTSVVIRIGDTASSMASSAFAIGW